MIYKPRLTFVVLALALAGCRSKLDVKAEQGAPLPQKQQEEPEQSPLPDETPPPDAVPPPEPAEVADGLALKDGRTQFQTRETIVISVASEVVSGATSFSLFNITNEATPIAILEDEAIPEGMSLMGEGFSLTPTVDGGKMILAFRPGENAWRGKFLYGKNRLKLVANDELSPRFSFIELTLKDFAVFGPALMALGSGEAASDGSRLQGWLNVMGPASVATSGQSITTGVYNIVNPN